MNNCNSGALINYVITSTPYGNYQLGEMVRSDGLEAFPGHGKSVWVSVLDSAGEVPAPKNAGTEGRNRIDASFVLKAYLARV